MKNTGIFFFAQLLKNLNNSLKRGCKSQFWRGKNVYIYVDGLYGKCNGMLKVDAVKSAVNGAESAKTSFGKHISVSKIASGIDRFMPQGIKQMQKVSDNLGEVSTTLINAAGTGLIAPVFIKYNPLSKSDQDTKTYSAWRQPVSAVLAIVSQLGAIIPFNKAMNNGFNLGMLSDQYNTSAFQDEKFIERQVKRNNPKMTKEQIAAEVSRIKKEQEAELLRSIEEENTVRIRKHGKEGTYKINKDVFNGAVEDSIEDLINAEEAEKSRLLGEKLTNRVRRSEFYRNNNPRTLDYMNEIEEILKKDDIGEIQKALRNKAKSLPKEENELRLITEELLGLSQGVVNDTDKKSVIDAMKAKVSKVRTHAEKYRKMHSLEEVEEAVKASINPRVKEVESNVEFFKSLQNKVREGASVKELQELVEKHSKKSPSLKKKGLNIVENVAESLKRRAKGSTRCLKQIGGVGIGLLMLPITCTLLNIIYPVFMDKFFPELSNKKKNKAPKTESEVKHAS